MKIVDVRTIPLSYQCEKPYMSAARGQAELLQEPIKAQDGFVKLPEQPGLGVELDLAVVERYRVRQTHG